MGEGGAVTGVDVGRPYLAVTVYEDGSDIVGVGKREAISVGRAGGMIGGAAIIIWRDSHYWKGSHYYLEVGQGQLLLEGQPLLFGGGSGTAIIGGATIIIWSWVRGQPSLFGAGSGAAIIGGVAIFFGSGSGAVIIWRWGGKGVG